MPSQDRQKSAYLAYPFSFFREKEGGPQSKFFYASGSWELVHTTSVYTKSTRNDDIRSGIPLENGWIAFDRGVDPPPKCPAVKML